MARDTPSRYSPPAGGRGGRAKVSRVSSDPGPRPIGRALRGAAEIARPTWVTGSAIRFLILCAFIAAVAMLSPRVSPSEAGRIALVGGLLTGAGALALLLATRYIAHVEETESDEARQRRRLQTLFGLLKATGLPLLGLAFFLVWSFVYLGMYWFAPLDAFRGLESPPRYADFFYYSVSTALISPPGDITAHSRGARAATMIEMLAGLALVTTYLSGLAVGRLGAMRAAARRGGEDEPAG
jgi:hypothetical protein